MRYQSREFLDALFDRCSREACLTLTAIHPTENRPVPSRHIPLSNAVALADALERLHAANQLGWGAYFGLASRRTRLTRWQRGDMSTLVEIPALIADIDEPPAIALPRVKAFPIPPSCIISSGHGLHVYFLLDQPTTDKLLVNAIHQGLAEVLHGDYLTAATSLRLPNTLNHKHGTTAACEVLESDYSQRYTLADFSAYRKEKAKYTKTEMKHSSCEKPVNANSYLIQQVTNTLLTLGFRWRGAWLNGQCPHAHHHKNADHRASFGFNTMTGYGYCFVCGSMLVRDLYVELRATSIQTSR